jgi:hypothetical protein
VHISPLEAGPAARANRALLQQLAAKAQAVAARRQRPTFDASIPAATPLPAAISRWARSGRTARYRKFAPPPSPPSPPPPVAFPLPLTTQEQRQIGSSGSSGSSGDPSPPVAPSYPFPAPHSFTPPPAAAADRPTPPPAAGEPLELVKPEVLRHKVFEPVLFIGKQKVKNLDIRLRVRGGGHVSQIYGERSGPGLGLGLGGAWRVPAALRRAGRRARRAAGMPGCTCRAWRTPGCSKGGT